MKEGMKNMDSFISWAGGKKALRGKIIKDAEDCKKSYNRGTWEPKGKKGAVIKHAPFL